MKKSNLLFRQGDVLIRRINALPKKKSTKRANGILAYGEVTGHSHRIEDLAKAELLEIDSNVYLRVSEEGVRIIHDEHSPVVLPAGNYEVQIQMEYSPQEIRSVQD